MMTSRAWALAFLPLAVACSGLDAAREPLNGSSERLVPREEVERDLSLTLGRLATDAFEIGHDPRLEVVLSNRSKTRSYPVVVSGDGSEAGFREPHVFYTVERRSSSSSPWEPATEQRVARCGNYDEDWTKDVVSLAPGEQIVLPWFGFPSNWELDGAYYARIVAHYAYGEHAREERDAPPELHGMPSYALASNALEVVIDPPLVLELSWLGTVPAADEPLSHSFAVVALNRGAGSLPFATADSGALLEIELEGDEVTGEIGRHAIASGFSVDDARDRIAPGSRREVVGNVKAWNDELPRGFQPRRARASLHVWWYTNESAGESDERTARSPWVAPSRPGPNMQNPHTGNPVNRSKIRTDAESATLPIAIPA